MLELSICINVHFQCRAVNFIESIFFDSSQFFCMKNFQKIRKVYGEYDKNNEYEENA